MNNARLRICAARTLLWLGDVCLGGSRIANRLAAALNKAARYIAKLTALPR